MSNLDVDYAKVLEDLRIRRAKLDAAISAVEEMVGITTPAPLQQTLPRFEFPPIIPKNQVPGAGSSGPFAGKTIIAAVVAVLKNAGRSMLTPAIVESVVAGGLKSSSGNMYRTVYNTLYNNQDKRVFRESNGAWGLKEWHQQ